MGLDVSHDCWHGAYSAFNRWRNKLAEVAGYKFVKNKYGYEVLIMDWDKFTEDNLSGKWETIPEDPLLILLVHYDCDGSIEIQHLIPLVDRLKELLDKLPDETGGGHIENWKEKTQEFIDGLEFAAERNETVIFC